tara:strand:+ start:3235 stop:3570 length:336 start_codon:yes stop_codon:yes gene_type:complete
MSLEQLAGRVRGVFEEGRVYCRFEATSFCITEDEVGYRTQLPITSRRMFNEINELLVDNSIADLILAGLQEFNMGELKRVEDSEKDYVCVQIDYDDREMLTELVRVYRDKI